jgi:hypothetical protein
MTRLWLPGLRSRIGCGVERAVEQLLVAEPAPEFAFESSDGDQVLRGTRVLVRLSWPGAGQGRQEAGGEIGEAGRICWWQFRRAFESDNSRPGQVVILPCLSGPESSGCAECPSSTNELSRLRTRNYA